MDAMRKRADVNAELASTASGVTYVSRRSQTRDISCAFGFRQRVHRATGVKTVSIDAIAARMHAIIEPARACVQLDEQVFGANKVFVPRQF
jgi:hypothetical protein